MKLSEQTISILKNFATINQSILVKEGSILSTMSVQKNLLAEATVEEKFPQQFGIYDLNEFLATLSLFDDPDLVFEDNHVKISDSTSTTSYWYADPSVIVYPEKTVVLPSEDVSFTLMSSDYGKLRKAAGVMNLSDFVISSNNGAIVAEVLDKRNDTSNTYALEVGKCNDDVKISAQNISEFTSGSLTYWVALEGDSSYEG